MGRKIVSALLLLFLAWVPHSAKADVVNNFVVCDTCVQPADFKQAALIWFGNGTAKLQVTVGNPSTGVLNTMWITPNGSGIPPAFQAPTPGTVGPLGETILVQKAPSNVIRPDQLALAPMLGNSPVVSDQLENSQYEPVFRAAVNANKNTIIFNVTDPQIQIYGDALQSFNAATNDPLDVSSAIWAEEDIVNPGFLKSTWTVLGAMQNALNSYFGHGILATVIFKNGDVATYQINILDPNATRYVNGTAKDRFGNALPDPPAGIGGGGAGGASVTNHGGTDATGYGMGSGSSEVWLVCSFIGGVLQSCYVTTVPY